MVAMPSLTVTEKDDAATTTDADVTPMAAMASPTAPTATENGDAAAAANKSVVRISHTNADDAPAVAVEVEVEVAALPALDDATVKEEGPGDFEIYYSNTENIPSEKQMPYIMMMATDCIEGFSVKSVHPYSLLMADRKLAGGGWVRKLNAGKGLVVQELMRRDPMARPNKSNRCAEEILRLFKPLTDPRDVAFVRKMEGEFRTRTLQMLEECEYKKTTPRKKRRRTKGDGEGTKREGEDEEVGSQRQQHVNSNSSLTWPAAERVMAAAEQVALSNEWKVSIAVADSGGTPMMAKRLNDAFPASFELAVGKAKTAVQFCKDADLVADAYDVSRGGLAIVIDGVCCGGIGVSGEKPAKLEVIAKAGTGTLIYCD